jgi:hypothetical protein
MRTKLNKEYYYFLVQCFNIEGAYSKIEAILYEKKNLTDITKER